MKEIETKLLINNLEKNIGKPYSIRQNCGFILFDILKESGFLINKDKQFLKEFDLRNLNKNNELKQFLDKHFLTKTINDKDNVYLILTKLNCAYANHISLVVNNEVFETENIKNNKFNKKSLNLFLAQNKEIVKEYKIL